jgi:head-tail adaptor
MARRSDRVAAGRRDRIVTIEERPIADTLDTEGAPIDGPWTTLVENMPAGKSESSGRERFVANQVSAPYDTTWEINYRSDMDPELLDVTKLRRLVVKGRVHDIVYVSEIGRRRGLEIYTLARPGA